MKALAASLRVLAGSALAAPPGRGLETVEVSCAGIATEVTVTGGSSFWIGDTHYVLVSFEGTFTPTEGEPESFVQRYGRKVGRGYVAISCTGSESDESGTFTFVAEGVAVP